MGRDDAAAAPAEREVAWVDRRGAAWQELVSLMVALVVSGSRQPDLCYEPGGAEIG